MSCSLSRHPGMLTCLEDMIQGPQHPKIRLLNGVAGGSSADDDDDEDNMPGWSGQQNTHALDEFAGDFGE
eukprot:scaffold1934_cov79-Cylindrotheca_fusiformis.AAC.7